MSRRHTSSPAITSLTRIVGVALVLALVIASALPVAAAQKVTFSDQDVERPWQLLTYLSPQTDDEPEPVPAGVSATVQMFSGSASGEAACSTFEAEYGRQEDSLAFDPPEIEAFECDPVLQPFEDTFYRHLANVASFELDESKSILMLNDVVGDKLMTLTRAVINDDPTVARWKVARIGAADGTIEEVIGGLEPWVEFLRGGRLVGFSGCGSFLGSYVINDGTIAVSDVASRLESCPEAARKQAESIIATLDEVTDFEVLPAGLVLKDGAGRTRLATTPDIELGRRTWTPIAIYDTDGVSLWPEPRRLSTSAVKFVRDATEGRTICQVFDGEGLRTGLALSVSAIRLQGDVCPKANPKNEKAVPQQRIEDDFIEALEATASHALRGSELELKDVSGRTLMRLLPQAPLTGTTWAVQFLGGGRKAPSGDDPLTATFEETEVVQGETGAATNTTDNFYIGAFRTPKAARIDISDVDIIGRACNTRKKAATAECKQEKRFVALLQQADSYVVRDTGLRLLAGTRQVMVLKPEVLESGDE